MKLRQWVVWSGLSVTLLVLPGCWDYESISTRAALVGLGIDPVENDPSKVRVTVEYPLLSPASGSSQGGMAQSSTQMFKNVTGEGESLSEVLRQIQLRMDKNIDTSQLRCIVFSQRLAPKTLYATVGELIRESRINRLTYVASTPGLAVDIMRVRPPEGAPLDVLDKTFSRSFRQHGYFVRRQLWEYWRDSVQFGKVPVMPNVVPASTANNENDSVNVEGFTVYQRNRPAIHMSRQDTLYVNMLTGQVRSMGVNVPTQEGIVALSDVRAYSQRRTSGSPSHLRIIDQVTVRATLSKVEGGNQQPAKATNLNVLQAQAAKYFKKQLNATMAQLQQNGADIIGFGTVYLQRHPDQENVVKYHWGEVFRRATPDIQVRVRISSKGMLI